MSTFVYLNVDISIKLKNTLNLCLSELNIFLVATRDFREESGGIKSPNEEKLTTPKVDSPSGSRRLYRKCLALGWSMADSGRCQKSKAADVAQSGR